MVTEGENTLFEKELLQRILDAPNIGIAVYKAVRNEEGKVIDFIHEFINKRTLEALGKDMTGKLLSDHGDDGISQIKSFVEALESGKPNSYVKHAEFAGSQHWVLLSNAPLDENRLVHTWEDITEIKRTELELQRSKETLQTAFDTSLTGLTVLRSIRNTENKIVDFEWLLISKKAKEYRYNIAKEGNRYLEVYPHIKELGLFERYVIIAEGGEPQQFETHYPHENTDYWFRLMVVKLDDGLLISSEDITEHKKAQQTLLEQQKETLNAIILAQEQERERIGEALHNGVAQLLYAMHTRLDMINVATEQDQEKKDNVYSILQQAIKDARTVSYELVPSSLRDHGVAVALESLIAKIIVDSKPSIQIKIEGLEKRLPEKFEYSIFRIVQELLNNIIKHSEAKDGQIKIKLTKKELELIVRDNGKGFDSSQASLKGIGLQHIKNRVALLNGDMKISSNNKGTAITINVPVV
jgi:signal transduction histidine kinase